MFEKYLNMEGFETLGSSGVLDVDVTLTSAGTFRTNGLIDGLMQGGYLKELRFYFNEREGVFCVEAIRTDNEDDFIAPYKAYDMVKEKIVPLIRSHNTELEPGLKFCFQGQVFLSEGKAFVDIIHPSFYAVPQKGRRRVEG